MTQFELVKLIEDAERYRFLRAHAFTMCPADRDGPGHPMIRFAYDTWGEHPETHNADGLDVAIDIAKS